MREKQKIVICMMSCFLLMTFYTSTLLAGKDTSETQKAKEEKLNTHQAGSEILFEDSMMDNWQEKWFLDGQKATLLHTGDGLFFSGGSVVKSEDPENYHAHHTVLWTKPVFEGEIRITYEMTRIDTSDYGNTLLYIQAQGIGKEPYAEDIYAWRELRKIPAMSLYWANMDLISLSWRSNIRCKRYPWQSYSGEKFPSAVIKPMVDYIGMIPGKKYLVEVEKRDESLTLRLFDGITKELLTDFTWDITKVSDGLVPVRKGRIGLRHMSTKQFIYKNFKVEQL